jgi:hypothetical protein
MGDGLVKVLSRLAAQSSQAKLVGALGSSFVLLPEAWQDEQGLPSCLLRRCR